MIDGRNRTNIDAGDYAFAENAEIAAGIRERTASRRSKILEIEPKTAGFGILANDSNGLQRGVGKALVGAAEAWVLTDGFGEMAIEIVRAENPHNRKFCCKIVTQYYVITKSQHSL